MSYYQPKGAASLPRGRDNEQLSRPRLRKLSWVLRFALKMNVLVPLFWGGMLLPVVSTYQKRPFKWYPATSLDVIFCICASLKRHLSAYGFLRWWVLFTKPLCFLELKFSPSNFFFLYFYSFFHQYLNIIKDTIQVNIFFNYVEHLASPLIIIPLMHSIC